VRVICPECITAPERQAADEASMALDEKVRENRLRRMAERQGLRLEKSRRRDPRAVTYGTYHLVNAWTNSVEAYGSPDGYGLTLDEVEAALAPPRSNTDMVEVPGTIGLLAEDGSELVPRQPCRFAWSVTASSGWAAQIVEPAEIQTAPGTFLIALYDGHDRLMFALPIIGRPIESHSMMLLTDSLPIQVP
jgi:hypothetical protein